MPPFTLLDVIYEDAEILVVNKPAGLVCHPTKTDEYSSLIGRARLYLSQNEGSAEGGMGSAEFGKPAGPHSALRTPSSALSSTPHSALPIPHLINRLDRETSGVTLIAKSSEVARDLGRIWENRQVEKQYLALVHGHVREDHGIIDAPLGKDEQSRVAIKDCVRPDGAAARTEFWTMGSAECGMRNSEFGKLGSAECVEPARHSALHTPNSALLLRPHTGRKHQIRIHLAHIGHPIIGDKLYGGDEDLYLALVEDRLTDEQRARLILPYHALHARLVRFMWRGEERAWIAERDAW